MAKVSKPTATRLLTSLSDYLEVKGTTGKRDDSGHHCLRLNIAAKQRPLAIMVRREFPHSWRIWTAKTTGIVVFPSDTGINVTASQPVLNMYNMCHTSSNTVKMSCHQSRWATTAGGFWMLSRHQNLIAKNISVTCTAIKNVVTKQWSAESVLDAAEIWSFGTGNTGSSTAASIIPSTTTFSTNSI